MTRAVRLAGQRLASCCLLLLALQGGSATAGEQTPPYDARTARETWLFRRAKPKPDDEVVAVPAGLVLAVSAVEKEGSWQGEKGVMVRVHPHPQSTYYALLPHLKPLSPAEGVPATTAGALLFREVPAGRRAWCEQFVQRLALPRPAGGKAVGTLVAWSASADDDCAGQLAMLSGTGKAARVQAALRLGPLQSVEVREVPGGGLLLDVVESLRGAQVSGQRRLLFALSSSGPRELLAADLLRIEVDGGTSRSVSGSVTLTPAGNGLDIEVRRSEALMDVATGTESGRTEGTRRYRYLDGKLVPEEASAAR